MKQRNSNKILLLIIFLSAVTLLIFILSSLFFSEKRQAEQAVDQFYEYEQNGLFSESWEMFHPLMQDKFPKGEYLEDRPHVFFNHFGVSTFSYSINEISKVEDWYMEEGSTVIPVAYKVSISQRFKSKYGNFSIYQSVYATEVDGEWRILWNYH
ncbi:hypothetical protein D8M04_06030 [Oceanobacillus piezotolerans]|uniref:DUF4440 domain-containing protein n=1 Tax=Oceanobacillus piezotolerans TaxID=2448030 RepID=A0A498DDM1_9BACI|nr:hypothetical protein [Oceanobacillus piezotolerans]RLL46760.1 hypothetical protein D8M04_06030 [Oceanobacillus piezotolerans]